MTYFILIHGALHGGWCWERVVPYLEARGHSVDAPDLPAMGEDRGALDEVTLGSWAAFVAERVRRAAEPPLLVGHSLGGLVIGEAAEMVPDRLLGMAYLAALSLPNGMSSNTFRASLGLTVADDVEIAEDGLSFRYKPDRAVAHFFNTTDPEIAAAAAGHLVPQPVAPLGAPVSVTADRFGRIPKAYIECMQDVVLPIASQRRIQTHWKFAPVIPMDTDHSPFLCAPGELADHLMRIADTFAAHAAPA